MSLVCQSAGTLSVSSPSVYFSTTFDVILVSTDSFFVSHSIFSILLETFVFFSVSLVSLSRSTIVHVGSLSSVLPSTLCYGGFTFVFYHIVDS